MEHFSGRELTRFSNFSNLLFFESDDNILRLEVGVNDLTNSVHVVKSNQTLTSKSSRKWHRYSMIVVSLDDLQKIDT